MTTAREAVRAALEPLGRPVVVSRMPEQIGKPTLALFTDQVAPEGTGRMRRWTLAVYVLTPLTEPIDADDELDAVLAQVLDAIDKDKSMHWSGAERGTASDSFNSFKVTVWIVLQEE